jgi:hypothetical protein
MEIADKFTYEAQRIGKHGHRGVVALVGTREESEMVMEAIQTQRITTDNKQTHTSFGIGWVDGGEYEITLPPAPPHERNRLAAVADRVVRKMKLKDRLRMKLAQKHETASTS